MKKMMLGLAAGALMLATGTAQASGLRLGQPGYGGTGCPSGSASVTLSPDETALSILFDQYIVEAGNTNGRTVDRKSCNITIPVQVPQGYSVSVFKVDYRGYNLVPQGGSARFDAEYFWAGSRGPRLSKSFRGPQNENFNITDELLATTLVWSPCGASVNLRVNSSMMVTTNARRDQTMSMVDSADVSSGILYHLQWRRCN